MATTRYVWEKFNTTTEDCLDFTYQMFAHTSLSGKSTWAYLYTNNILNKSKDLYYAVYTSCTKLQAGNYTFTNRIKAGKVTDGSLVTVTNSTAVPMYLVFHSSSLSSTSTLTGVKSFIAMSTPERFSTGEANSCDYLTTFTFKAFKPSSETYWSIDYESTANVKTENDPVYGTVTIGGATIYTTKQNTVKGTSAGYISDKTSSTYPNDGASGSYWYVYKGSDNIDPTAISYPTSTVNAGGTIKITITASTGIKHGGTITYIYQRSSDGGSWAQAKSSTSTSYTDTVPTSTKSTVKYRVYAKDNYGFTSSTYVTGSEVPVFNNSAPTISGSDTNLGSFSNSKPNDWGYTVVDENGDSVTVTESIDGVVKRSYTVSQGVTNYLSFTNIEWMKVLNGSHTVTISAKDAKGAESVRTLTFSKNVTSLRAMFNPPLESDDMVTKAIENITAVVPSGATIKIEVCNNALDTSPTWEDVTNKVLSGQKFAIANTKKTTSDWAYNIRVTIERGTATGEVSFSGISGFFA